MTSTPTFSSPDLQRMLTRDKVAELIEQAIVAGKMNPGDRINELQIARELGVGTTSVREALYTLERRGLVTRVSNKGAYVTRFTPEDTANVYRVRAELEGLAAELMAERATQADFERLQQHVDEMRAAAATTDISRFYHADLAFHRSLGLKSHNRYLSDILESLNVPLFAFYEMRTKKIPNELMNSAEAHQKILDAIKTGNGREARRIVEQSINFFYEQGRKLRS